MITILAKLLKMLNSEADPHQISAGFCLAMITGFTPLWSLHNLLVLFLILIFRVNLSAFLLGWALFSGIAYLLDPMFHALGYKILTAGALTGLWTALYNMDLFRLANFNNSLVMGSLVVSLALFVPLLLILNLIIQKYREHILAWVRKTRLAQIVNSSRLFSIYKTLSEGGRS